MALVKRMSVAAVTDGVHDQGETEINLVAGSES
jgi:hypothetical protein